MPLSIRLSSPRIHSRCYDSAPPDSLTIDPVEIEEDEIRFYVPQARFVAQDGAIYETKHTYESIGLLYDEADVRGICELPILHFRVYETYAILTLGRTPRAQPRSIRSRRAENTQIASECKIDSFYLTLYKQESRDVEIPTKHSNHDIKSLLCKVAALEAENARLREDNHQLQKINISLGVTRINNPNRETVT